jgi:hypothetical protein
MKTNSWSSKRPLARPRRGRTRGALAAFVLFVLAATGVFGVATARAATYNAWTAQSPGVNTTWYGVWFSDASNGWLVGGSGNVRHTTNGGTTWTAQTSGTTQNLRGVCFVGTQNGWAVGGGGVVYHTTNGGTTWASQTSGVTGTIYGVSFVDANNGWFCTTNGVVRHTTNGGTTWTAQTTGITSTIYAVDFTDANNGWLVTTSGGVRHTTNGGTTWTAQTLSPTTTQSLRGVYFVNSQIGWVVGGGGAVYHTTNGGTTWSSQTSGTTQTIYDVDATDANNAWTVAGGGVIDHSANAGSSWAAQTSGTTQGLRSVCGAGGSLWACGGGGVCLTYLIDSTPPVTTATGLQASASTGWQTSSQTVTLSATDSQSGVVATYYKVDGGAQTTYTAPFTISTQGSHTVVYWSVDKAGNTETSHTGYVNIDATPPTTTATGLQSANNTGWQKTGQTVTLTATDAVSGVATTQYTVDGGAAQLYGGPFLISGNGSHMVTYWSTDNAGNIETAHAGYVNIDTTPPTTTATGLQASGSTGWQNTSQIVSLAANDSLSGVAATYYTIDGGAQQTYTAPFTISAQGSHTVAYWSVDAVGNTEATNTGYVNIDLTAPTVSDNSDGNWHNQPVTITLTPADTGGSGVAGTQYRLQGSSTWLNTTNNQFVVPAPSDGSRDGVHVYQYRALDNAGNSSTIGSCTVWIDTTAPTTTAVGLAADDLSGWRTTSQTVTLSADDGLGSGVANIFYTVDGGATQTYSAPFVVSGEGQHPVTYWATDAAGNVEATQTGWVNISNPYAQATGLVASATTGWQDSPASVTITGVGDHAPISVTYGIDGATPQKAASDPATFTVSTQGSHPVVYWATNSLGVDSLHETGYVNLDLTAPVTTATNLQTSATTGWSTTGVTVTLNATDTGGSGLSSTWYTVDGGSAQLYTGPFLVTGDGSHPVSYWSVDAAGNVETHDGTHNIGYVNIDSTPPTTTATGLQPSATTGWVVTSQTVTLSATDAGSGMSGGSAATYYTVDNGAQQTYSSQFQVSGDGSHTVVYWSVDAVGNVEAHHTGYVNIDSTPPTTTATGLQSSATSGWVTNTAPVTVTLVASDATSGMSGGSAATYYTVDGGAQQTYTGPFQVSGDGSHKVTYWSVDAAGNVENHNIGYVNIDSTPPTTTATGLQSSATSGWTNAAQVSVTLTATDAISGMVGGSAATYYTIDGGPQQTYGGAFTVTAEGSHTIVYWSVDAAGNVESKNTGYVNIDRTAPTTTATGLQSNATTGWQNTSQMVSLAATDALSGAATTYYKLDTQPVQTYTNPFGVSGQGSHTVVYWSVDAAGNVESQNTGYVNIDSTAPTVSDNADTAWHNQPVTITLTPTDTGGSGVAGTQYRLQGSSTWLNTTNNQFVVPAPSNGSGDGANVYQYRALDNAGNASATETCTVKIDTQGPVVTTSGLQPDDLTGWQTTSQQVTLSATDAGSGVAAIYYTVDGGSQTTYTGPFTISNTTSGSHAVVYWAVDQIGNVTTQKTGYVNISNPYAQATNLAPNATSGWHNAATTVTITGSGDHTPITISYSTNGGTTWTTVASPASLTFSTQGSHAITYYATNSVNVQSVTETGYCNIDLTKPTTTATGLQTSATTGWQTASQTVTLTASDTGGSGLASTTYTVDGGSATTYTAPFVISANGSHTVTYYSTDNAGNVEATHTGYVNIDTQAPTTTAAGLTAQGAGWVTNSNPVTVTLTASDSGSGMSGGSAATYYTLDGSDQTTYTGSFQVSGDGQHIVTYWSVDALGNTEATNTGYVNIDTTPPTTTATNLAASASTGWQDAPVTVTLSASDAVSGVAATYYTIDGGTQQTYSTPFTVSAEGSHTIVYWSVDAAGNVESQHTGYVNVDLTPPTVTDNAGTAWHDTAVTVTLTASDALSGVAATQYRPHGTQTWLPTSGNTFSVPAPADHSNDGSHTFDYQAIDNAGNVSALGTCTVNIDTRAPTTSALGLQADNHSGWQNTAQTVTLSGNDGSGSGVSSTSYNLNGGATQSYTAPFQVSTAGSTAVSYWSVDNAGNSETPNLGYVNIDTTPPTVTDNADTAWHNSDVVVQLTPADSGGSGVACTQYRLQGSQTWLTATDNAFTVPAPADHSNDGSHTYQYEAIDNAGNTSAIGTCTVNIDTTPPQTTTSDLQTSANTGWQTTSQVVHLSATDAGSGMSGGSAATYYTLDGGARQTYTGPFTVSGSKSHRIVYWSVDALGNIETPHIGFVNIDTVPPVTSATNLAAASTSGWVNTPQLVSLTASDGLSGVAATYYTVDGGAQQTYTGPFTISADGQHTVTYWSVDNAGNTEATEYGYVNIDTTPPTSTATGLQPDSLTGWQTTAQTVTLTASDGTGAVSGVQSITYTVDGGSPQTYSGPFTVSGDAQHEITYFATDNAGNVEATHTGWVNISNPYAQSSGLTGDPNSDWQTSVPATATITAGGDNAPFTIYYSTDGGNTWTTVASSTATISESTDGSHEIEFYAKNSVDVPGVPQTCYLNVDQTPPTTTAQGLQTSQTAGWATTPQTVTLSASDATSGMSGGSAATYYTVDGGAQQTYSGPFQVSGDGSHTVTYWSVDAAGNVETPANVGYVNIDSTPPTVSDNSDGAWHNTPVTVTVTADDDPDGSGVASVQYRLQGSSTWLDTTNDQFVVPAPSDGSNDGVHTYEYQATDNAGNTSATGTCTVKIDTQGPVVTNDADTYWHNTAVTVNLQATDAGAGVSTISYRLQGASTWTTVNAAQAAVNVALPTDGQPHSYTYEYTATDAIGNATPVATFTVNIDPSMPNTIIHGLPTAAWVNHPVSLTFTATAGTGAPIVRTEYSLDGGTTWTPIATGTSLVVSTAGQTSLLYRSVNAAGTVETPAQSAIVRIDLGKPSAKALKNVTIKRNKVGKLPYRVSDPSPSCGYAKVTITIYLKKKVVKRIVISKAATNRNLVYKYKAKLKPGTYTWKVSAVDIAGNKQTKLTAKKLIIK